MDLTLNNLQWLICHKTQQTNQPSIVKNISLSSIQFIQIIFIQCSISTDFVYTQLKCQ